MQTCNSCGREIKPGREVWLELNTETGEYTDQPVPEEHSQGAFVFGTDCAKKELRKNKLARARLGAEKRLAPPSSVAAGESEK